MRLRLLAAAAAAACFACAGEKFEPGASASASPLTELQLAVFDPTWMTPACAAPGAGCSSGTLLVGRGTMTGAPELNAPNTVGGTCADSPGGVYEQSSSIDAIRIRSEDGGPIAEGKAVVLEVDAVYRLNTQPIVALFWAPAPGAVFSRLLGETVLPFRYAGESTRHTVSYRFIVPAGGPQVLRAAISYRGAIRTCMSEVDGDTDSDDVVYAVAPGTPDATPPTVAMISPSDGAQVNGTVRLAATASDDQVVTKVQFLVDGVVAGTSLSPPWAFDWDTRFTARGSRTLSARAYDAVGNLADSAPIVVEVLDTPDVTPPHVSLSSPTGAAVCGGTVLVTGRATDPYKGVVRIDAVAGLELTREERLFGTLELATPRTEVDFAFPWDTTLFPDGRHAVTIYAYDAAGNRGYYTRIALFVDNVPQVRIETPVEGAAVKGDVTISAQAGNANGIARVEFFVDGALVGTSTAEPFSVPWSAKKPVTTGSHVLTARAVDVLGFSATSAPVTIVVR